MNVPKGCLTSRVVVLLDNLTFSFLSLSLLGKPPVNFYF